MSGCPDQAPPSPPSQVDISGVVIEQMRRQHKGVGPQLSYQVVDARAMPQFASGSFGSVLDKGTLDALLCWCGAAAPAPPPEPAVPPYSLPRRR